MLTQTIVILMALGGRSASALEMPAELSQVQIGMSVADLAKLYPKAKRYDIGSVSPLDPTEAKRGPVAVQVELPSGREFTWAAFSIRDGRLVRLELTAQVKPGKERAARRKAVRDAAKRWGPPTRRVVLEDDLRVHGRVAGLIWEIEGIEIGLVLPRDRLKDELSPGRTMLIMRSIELRNKPPWKEIKWDESTRKEFFTNDLTPFSGPLLS
jgi:hypothetical protein